ncbi:Wadjet anti-phage system protein JetA family protein [Thiocystis violacea]|uniref:Wadjet anti-phage system protein JetA family protein n=1 Tax=Thiocystis violacea TaxID=13725 RepID=UPI0019050A90|nr:Wadjet anti-phage system protein JetA family protein [Thiocystis violacea]
MSQLFDRVSDRLFSPLASANRQVYAGLLLDLYPLFFDQVHEDVFPSRETVRREIEERLAVMAASWQDEADPTAQEADGTPAALAYRRLVAAGWLEEETEGYRVRVAVPPAVGTLWAALVEIARPDRVFYGGMVLSIFNNVQRAYEEPRAQVLALRQASREARRFLQHINTMIYGLKGLLGEIGDARDHRLVLSRFFDDFVERILVQDYKRLKTRNNPFRHRLRILQLVRELEYDLPRKQELVAGFMEQTGEADSELAWRAMNDDIVQLRAVFEQLDGHLARVDTYRAKVERRVADRVRYLDRAHPGMATRIAAALQRLGPKLADLPEDAPTPLPMPLLDVRPVGTRSLREAPRHRRLPEPLALRSRPADPAVAARQQALRAYLDRRRIDPRRIARYLECQLAGRGALDGADMRIESVEDFIAFTHVRHLEYLPGATSLRRQYRIERRPGWVENDWVRCPAFVAHRRSGAAGSRDAA